MTARIQDFDNTLSREEVMHNALFVLDQGWNKAIRECTEAGASIVLPNFHMSTTLLMQTIIREGKSVIATTKELWEKIQDAFTDYPQLRQKLSVFLFEQEENIKFQC
jgi:hypothetical protein